MRACVCERDTERAAGDGDARQDNKAGDKWKKGWERCASGL